MNPPYNLDTENCTRTKLTPLYENEQNEREILQWRLLRGRLNTTLLEMDQWTDLESDKNPKVIIFVALMK